MSSDYQLDDTLYLPFTTRAFATGIPTALVSGAIDIYEDVTATPIITGETLAVSLNSVAGFNMITVTATSGTGFGAGQSYTAILQAGTVDGVSVVGEVVAHFTLDMSAAAKDLANGTDGLGAIKDETALIVADTNELQADDVPGLIATAQADLDTITGAAGALLDSTATSAQLVDDVWDEALSGHLTTGTAGQFLTFAGAILVDTTATGTPTPTEIQITAGSAIDNFYNDQMLRVISGTGVGQARPILSYVGATKTATVDEPFITTPISGDGVIITSDHIHPIVQIANGVWDEAMVETTGAPAVTGTFRAALEWMFGLSRNEINQTATTTTLRNDADDADLATSTVSDDATTYVRGKWST